MKVSKVLNKNVAFNHNVNKLCIDSRNIKVNDIFFAIKGSKTDGNLYVKEAIRKGAKTIVTEDASILFNNINVVVVNDINKYLGECCLRFYGDLSRKVKLCGITGTNGKSSSCTLIYKYLMFLNEKSTLISTYGIYINDLYYETVNTTPDIITIYEIIVKSIKEKCKYVIMEVSSHAVKLNRIYGLSFYIGGLTNITHDHLDFHKTFEDYKLSKTIFLTRVKHPIINYNYNYLLPYLNSNVFVYGDSGNIKINNVDESVNGLTINYNICGINRIIKTNLLCKFNSYNIALFICAIIILDKYDSKMVDLFFNNNIYIPGRMEILPYKKKVIIDFAHTPDAIKKVLLYLNKIKGEGLVTCVVGMGGDRDRSKRSIVGKIVTELSDFAVFTEDNSRSEKVEDIINDIVAGVSNNNNYVIVYDRKEAITKAINISSENDIICILGRGCEEYLEKENSFFRLLDKDIAIEVLENEENY